MHKKYILALFLVLGLLVYSLVRKSDVTVPITNSQTNNLGYKKHKSVERAINYAESPTGELIIDKHIKDIPLAIEIFRAGAETAEDVERFIRKKPLPWNVGLDTNGDIVKIYFDDHKKQMISFDHEAIGKFREFGFEIIRYGFDGITIGNKDFYRQLYLNEQINSEFAGANEQYHGGSYDKIEVFPVMVRYGGTISKKDMDNMKYLDGKIVPMLLIREQGRYLSEDDLKSDNVCDLLVSYGKENTKVVSWSLIPFSRNPDEQTMFEKMPHYFGCGYHVATVTIDSWEKFHGRKYTPGEKFAKPDYIGDKP